MRLEVIGPAWADAVHALLAAAVPFEAFSAALTREKLFDAVRPDDRTTVLAALEGDALVGVAQSVVRPAAGRAWLGLFAVAPAARRRGVASALLGRVTAEWAAAGAREAGVLAIPGNYCWPGLDPRAAAAGRFLEARGFERAGDAVSLVADLAAAVLDTGEDEGRLATGGIAVRRATADDGDRLAALFAERFGEDWRHEVERARALSPPALHLALAGGRVVGFAAHSAMNREWGWFGPMGTAAAFEGRGIGRVLLRRALGDLRAAGHQTAVIPWAGPVGFYRRHVPCPQARVFRQYRKRL